MSTPLRNLYVVALLMAATPLSHAAPDRWYECQGRTFGYVQKSAQTLDFYNLYYNCPKLRILSRKTVAVQGSNHPRSMEILVVDNRAHQQSCPFQVFGWTPIGPDQVLPEPPSAISFDGFKDLAELESVQNKVGVSDSFSCSAYLVDAHRYPHIVQPHSKHARSVRTQLRDRAAIKLPARQSAPASPTPASTASPHGKDSE
ncbi:MAG: hypothetical protein C4K60_14380 [Ideonella sp. MAG2]|nr:MAG: hypothetical protein C4K60_14380 [Ideonella sp. MAG2]